MAVGRRMTNTLLESNIHSTPLVSSPSRYQRKSMVAQASFTHSTISENDDEAERLARRHVIPDCSTPISSVKANDRRHSLGLGFLVNMPASQMVERISQCIKLGTENKINPKNAFKLELIDFMTYMIKKKDVNMSNLQVASTSLDVSTKIYGYRVDGIHSDILKMAGGLDKEDKDYEHAREINSSNMQEMLSEGETVQNGDKRKKNKKKMNKQGVFITVEALRANINVEKPCSFTIEADSQTTEMLCQAMLPNHANSKFYQHPYNDVLLDTVNYEKIQYNDIVHNILQLPNFSNLEICPPLFYFDFQTWNADDELSHVEPEKNNDNRFSFDLDASVPREEEHIPTGINYFDIEERRDENVEKCAIISTAVENIVDFQEVLSTRVISKASEYSFVQENLNMHWAGPSYWKVFNSKKPFSNSRVIETCRQAPMKKRKDIKLYYDDEVIKNINCKFIACDSLKSHARTAKVEWTEEVLTLPSDEHYDITQAKKLYLHQKIFKPPDNNMDSNVTPLPEDNDNISNDCCNVSIEQPCQNGENDMQLEDVAILGSQMAFTGDNLIPIPKLTNKLSIAYSVRTKKVDMRQLKQAIWKCLNSGNPLNKQNERTEISTSYNSIQQLQYDRNSTEMNGPKYFSSIYKKLPSMLTKTNIEALSFPLSFVSLLHLANEKTLKMNSSCDMADLIIN